MNKKFRIEVYNHTDAPDAPNRLEVEISSARADEIRRMSALVREHKKSLDVHSITAWDYSTDWFIPAGDPYDFETSGDQQRMDCCEIVVTEDAFYYQALVKDCDVACFSDRIPLAELSEAEAIRREIL
jgi:hypothetical protein